MRLIVGLGNPGRDYARTRHNAGFLFVDHLAQHHGMDQGRGQFHSQVREGRIAGTRTVLLKPQTFMNRSGLAVAAAVAFYKLELEHLLEVVDDTALQCGRTRLRRAGGGGGHNGLADIERALGTTSYPRLRIGIDGPGSMRQEAYVLSPFSPEQLPKLDGAIQRACDAVTAWITSGIELAMNQCNAD